MSSLGDSPEDGYGYDAPPPRPTTPPVRRGFVLILLALSLAAAAVYGAPYMAERLGRSWEAGRAKAAAEALGALDANGAVDKASSLFRLATTAISPAVVNVQSFHERGSIGRHGLPMEARPGRSDGPGRELGSGVVIDRENGYVVTNNHVVAGADRIVVRLGPRDDVPARLVGADPKTDLAVLQIKADIKVAASWGDSDKLDIGDWVLAIGSPMGFDHSVTAGIVSATERNDLKIAEYESFIQTDAAINPGNSGGPLVDLAGRVVGINTAIITQSGGYEGIGLAIPSSLAKRVVESLIREGKVTRGYLGVSILPVDGRMAGELKLPEARGVLVTSVLPDGPAAQADLQSGDVLVKLANRVVDDPTDLRYVTADLAVGEEVPLVLFRNGAEKTVSVRITAVPSNPEISPLGFSIKEVPNADGKTSTVEVDRVTTAGPAFHAGLRPGMKIMAVDKMPVGSVMEFLGQSRNYDFKRGLPLVVATLDGRFVPLVLVSPSEPPRDQPRPPMP